MAGAVFLSCVDSIYSIVLLQLSTVAQVVVTPAAQAIPSSVFSVLLMFSSSILAAAYICKQGPPNSLLFWPLLVGALLSVKFSLDSCQPCSRFGISAV